MGPLPSAISRADAEIAAGAPLPQGRSGFSRISLFYAFCMVDLPSSHRLRKGRHSQAGVTYMVTTTTIGRAPIFRDLTAARCVVRTLAAAVERGELELLAYVLMPDHLHCLLTFTGSLSLQALMQQLKSVSAHRCGRRLW